MEFQTNRTALTPKNLYPCTATITVVPHGTDTRARRLSAASFGSNSGGGAGGGDADDNGLKRVISGGRRRTSFGVVADRGDLADGARRKSFSGDGANANRDENNGKWYWRVQAGTVDGQLVLLPLTQPPNPVLTSPPQPLSHAMPAHSHAAQNGRAPGAHDSHAHTAEGEHEGIGAKIKNLFRRSSTMPDDKQHHDAAANAETTTTGAAGAGDTAVADPPINNGNDAMSQATTTTATAVDRVLDQTAQGEMLPSAGANAVGATNVNANAESGWPGVIHGQHLQSIVVDLHSIDKSKVTLGGGGKKEGSYVLVHISGAAHSGIEPIGQNHLSPPKSGTIKFEFDKDWIGGKGEAEVLHHYITTALDNLPARAEPTGDRAGERGFPQAENFQLGNGNAHATGGAPNVPSANLNLGREIAPEQKAF